MSYASQEAGPRKQGSIVLLFGAGASSGVGGCSPSSPPLGAQLFEELSRSFQQSWGGLPKYLEDIFRDSNPGAFERGMGRMVEEARLYKKWNLKTYQKDVSQYFARFRTTDSHSSRYHDFVRRYRAELAARAIVVGSLNYECLLDEAIQLGGLPLAYKPGEEGIKLMKVHGSCNFVPSLQFASLEHYANKIIVPFDVAPLDGLEQRIERNEIQSAMRFYTKDKDNLTCSAELDAILAEFQGFVGRAALVAVVGVRPNPEDGHIWDHLRDTKARVVLISPDPACEDWLSSHRAGRNCRWCEGKFNETKVFDDLCGEIDIALYTDTR